MYEDVAGIFVSQCAVLGCSEHFSTMFQCKNVRSLTAAPKYLHTGSFGALPDTSVGLGGLVRRT